MYDLDPSKLPEPNTTERGKRILLPEETEFIIEAKLQHWPTTKIAEAVQCSHQTVVTKWRAYCAAQAKNLEKNTAAVYGQTLARYERAIEAAWRGYTEAELNDDPAAATTYLNTYIRALTEHAKYGPMHALEPQQQKKIEQAQITARVEAAQELVKAVQDATATLPAEQTQQVVQAITTHLKALEAPKTSSTS